MASNDFSDDDLLDAAADDLDDMLDLAADDLLAEEDNLDRTRNKTQGQNQLASKATRSYEVPKVWQEALNVLDMKDKIEWAGIIQADISRQANQDYGYRIYSNAYNAGRGLKSRNETSSTENLTSSKALAKILKRSADSTGFSGGNNIALVSSVLEDKNLVSLFEMQLARDLESRLKALPKDIQNVKAQPQRFPECAKLCS